jgi:hypothetical protein
MMEDFDIPLRRAPVAETPIASGGGIYAKIYRHSRSDLEASSIDNHEVVLVLQGCGMARRRLAPHVVTIDLKQIERAEDGASVVSISADQVEHGCGLSDRVAGRFERTRSAKKCP